VFDRPTEAKERKFIEKMPMDGKIGEEV